MNIFRNSHQETTSAQARQQAGMTLVELMIAVLIGSFVMLGAVAIYSQSRSNYRLSDTVSRLQENARFAISHLQPDIRLAKYWGRNREPSLIAVPAGILVTCDDGADASDWALQNLGQELAVADDDFNGPAPIDPQPCAANTAARAQSDMLILRRASGQVMPVIPGNIQVLSDLTTGQVFTGALPVGLPATSEVRDVVINVYYVDNGSNLSVTLPSLRRKTLVNGGILQDEEIMAGVENLQVQYGVDTDNDQTVERYVDADHPIVTPTDPGFLPNAEIIAVRLWLLMRSDQLEAGYVDVGPYVTPDVDVLPIVPAGNAPAVGNYPQAYRRLQVSKTILLRNNRG